VKVANTWWIAGFLLSAQLLFAQSVKPAAAPKTSPAPKTSAPQAAKPAQPAPPPPKPSASGSTASQEKSEDQTKPEVSAPTQEEEPVPGGKRRDPFRTLIEPKKTGCIADCAASREKRFGDRTASVAGYCAGRGRFLDCRSG